MDEYTMQSYFKELSNAYYIACKQMKRVDKEYEQLSKYDRTDELGEIKKLQGLDTTAEVIRQYLSPDFTKEKLEEVKSRLEKEQQDYEEKKKKLYNEYTMWRKRKEYLDDLIREAIVTVKANGFHIIVTSKEQIIALLSFFAKNGISKYRVINMEEEHLRLFPAEEKLYQEFFGAYCIEDDSLMQQLCENYV